jgi:hypothetical protein
LFKSGVGNFGKIIASNEILKLRLQQLFVRITDWRFLSANTNQIKVRSSLNCDYVYWDRVKAGFSVEDAEIFGDKGSVDIYLWVVHVWKAELFVGAELSR